MLPFRLAEEYPLPPFLSRNEKTFSISRVLCLLFAQQMMTIYLGPALLQASVGLPGEVPALLPDRNGPFPLSLFTLFSLSSRRDCRVSPPAIFMAGTRLCGSNPLCTASDTKGGRYPLRCPAKLGLSSHSGWPGRFPALVICARSSEKAFSKNHSAPIPINFKAVEIRAFLVSIWKQNSSQG